MNELVGILYLASRMADSDLFSNLCNFSYYVSLNKTTKKIFLISDKTFILRSLIQKIVFKISTFLYHLIKRNALERSCSCSIVSPTHFDGRVSLVGAWNSSSVYFTCYEHRARNTRHERSTTFFYYKNIQ